MKINKKIFAELRIYDTKEIEKLCYSIISELNKRNTGYYIWLIKSKEKKKSKGD